MLAELLAELLVVLWHDGDGRRRVRHRSRQPSRGAIMGGMDPLLVITHLAAAVGGWLICRAQTR
ncbi:hypothetical protein GCM10023340_39100 [Nocardioides marinquilinus]|uniref:Uncharacterized protein n=1 Tax=Nocardioides marinquilinus TaxID=1210400 RepID=A0ABP9Q6M7_9ACTN